MADLCRRFIIMEADYFRFNLKRRKILRAFTLVELIIVVIIIGILASVSIPQYNKVMERSRIVEASNMLGSLRGAQLRYKLETTNYATALTSIDVDMPDYDNDGTKNDGKFFTYNVVNIPAGAITTVATADRKSNGMYGEYKIEINESGKVSCAGTLDCAGFVSQ